MRVLLTIVTLVSLPSVVFATHPRPLVDGGLSVADQALYGAPLFVQTIQTGFGNTNDPDPRTAGAGDADGFDGGSEMDALYAMATGGRLYVMMTGNLENNYNKWDLLIDSVAGGFNTMPDDPNNDQYPEIDGLCYGAPDDGQGAIQNLAGLTFDAGFEADYYMMFTNAEETEKTTGNENKSWVFSTSFSPIAKLQSAGGRLPAGPTPEWGAIGGNQDAVVPGGTLIDGLTADPDTNPFENFYIEREMDNSAVKMEASIDNSNIDGVGGMTGDPADQAAALAVTTGIEFSIPLAAIGYPSGDIKISAFINNGSHDWLSNQISGGLPVGFGNLGPVADGIDFNDYNGTQHVTLTQTELLGDMDINGITDFDDIDDFVDALNGSAAYELAYGVPPDVHGDTDGNGIFDFDDIAGLITILGSGSLQAGVHAVPEPSAVVLAAIAGCLAATGYRVRKPRRGKDRKGG